MAEIDLEVVRHALTVARANGFASVEISVAEASFSALLTPSLPIASVASISDSAVVVPQIVLSITAPVVGYFRNLSLALHPGMQVNVGDVVAEIVALGIANDVESKVTGVVKEVLVLDDQPVEYGQLIAVVEPA